MGTVISLQSRIMRVALNQSRVVDTAAVDSRNIDTGSGVTTDADWRALIHAMAMGDPSTMREFFESSRHLVYGLVMRIVRNHETAEDVTVEVYSQVWRNAATYDPSRGTPSTWLLTLARSRAIDAIRARRHDDVTDYLDEIAELESTLPDPENTIGDAERGRFVRGALQHLSPEQRDAIELAFFSGLSHSEIAERLEQPLGTVKTRIRMGMLKLRDLLNHLDQPGLAVGER